MSLFAIADLHLSLGTDKPMDIFSGWDNYIEKLTENWDALLTPNDTIVIGGDISWAMTLEESKIDFQYIHERPGKKLILKGNHDYWWATKSKMDTFFSENGFNDIGIIHNSASIVGDTAVCGTRGWMYNSDSPEDIKIIKREAGRLRLSILEALKLNKEPIVFLHYPPIYDNFESKEILSVLEEYAVTNCYFGHIHGQAAAKKAFIGNYNGINMKLIAGDYINFCPILVSK